MTVSEALTNWLTEYDSNDIDTDLLGASTTSYALTKEPTINIKRYLSGRTERTEYYQFTARLDSQLNEERKLNSEWLENLEKWIEEQKANNKMPTIEGATVRDVFISTGYYLGQNAEDNSVYSLTIGIKYTR